MVHCKPEDRETRSLELFGGTGEEEGCSSIFIGEEEERGTALVEVVKEELDRGRVCSGSEESVGRRHQHLSTPVSTRHRPCRVKG